MWGRGGRGGTVTVERGQDAAPIGSIGRPEWVVRARSRGAAREQSYPSARGECPRRVLDGMGATFLQDNVPALDSHHSCEIWKRLHSDR